MQRITNKFILSCICLLLIISGLVDAFPRRKMPATIDPALVDSEGVSADTSIEKNAYGECMCDLTRNACDAYCCCDEDCGAAILDVWNSQYDQICAKNYIGQAFKPDQKCISSKQLYDYNERMGMSVTDELGLFCVEMDAGTDQSTYQKYVETVARETTIESLEGFDLTQSIYANTTYSDRYGISNAFAYRDQMLSLWYDGYPGSVKVYQNFMLPQRDLFGFCDNYKSPSFLQDIDIATQGGCVQVITSLETAAQTILNPQQYMSSLSTSTAVGAVAPSREYVLGSSPASSSGAFAISAIYSRDPETGAIEDVTAANPTGPGAPVYTYTPGVTCQVENYVSELLYRVYFGENEEGQYTIIKITIDFMLEKKLQLDEIYCQADNENAHLLTQKFGIEFAVARTDAEGTQITTLQGIADTGKVQRSGNPGYQLMEPLIVGMTQNSNEVKQVQLLGTYLHGPDTLGRCLAKELTGGPSQRLDFAKHQSLSCYQMFEGANALANFEAFCNSETARTELEIFAQFIERFQFIAIFGNPNLNAKGDWIQTIYSEAETALKAAGAYDADRKSCKMNAALDVEIITSRVGYQDHLQNYVVGARVKAIEREFVFDGTLKSDGSGEYEPQEFSMYVSVAFSEILPKELEASGFVSFSLIKGNLFYPFEIKGGAMANVTMSALSALAALAILQF